MATGDRSPKGEQLDLLDVGPENIEKITPHLRKYKTAVKQRQAALKIEVEEKQIIQALVMEAQLIPLPDGHIKFACEGFEIDIEPTDVVIHVKEIKAKKKRGRKSKGESKPNQGQPTGKEKKKKKRTVKTMADQVAGEVGIVMH